MEFIKKIIKHELVTGSFFIFAGSMFANFLAFLLNLFLARNLTYADYAVFASLSSVITLASIPATSINTIIIKFAASYFAQKQNEKLKTLYLIFFKFILGLSFSVILISILLANPLKSYLKIDNIWYIFISGIAICAFYFSILNTAFLQSLLKFKFLSLVNAFGGIVKLAVGITLVMLGYKAFSGLWAIVFMMFGMFIIGFMPLVKVLNTKSLEKLSLQVKELISYAIPTFITVLFLTSFTSTDVILVKHFFNSHLAGYYAGLSLMGKVIFYFTFPIPMVMFPLLVKRHSKGIKFNNLFYLSLILVTVPSIFLTFFYFTAPDFFIKLFLGGREYLYVAPYLGMFGFYLTVFSLVNVCVNFFLSLNQTNISIPVVGAGIFQIILIYIYHSNFYEIIGVSLLVLSLLLIFLLYIFFKNYGNWEGFRKNIAFFNSPGL